MVENNNVAVESHDLIFYLTHMGGNERNLIEENCCGACVGMNDVGEAEN